MSVLAGRYQFPGQINFLYAGRYLLQKPIAHAVVQSAGESADHPAWPAPVLYVQTGLALHTMLLHTALSVWRCHIRNILRIHLSLQLNKMIESFRAAIGVTAIKFWFSFLLQLVSSFAISFSKPGDLCTSIPFVRFLVFPVLLFYHSALHPCLFLIAARGNQHEQ